MPGFQYRVRNICSINAAAMFFTWDARMYGNNGQVELDSI